MHNGHPTHSNTNPYGSHRKVSGWRRLWDTRSIIIFVYLFRFAFAFSLARSFADRVDISSYRHAGIAQTPGEQSVLLFVENARQLFPTIHQQCLLVIGITLLYFLLVPFVSMIWIYAIGEPGSLRTNTLKAARCYHASFMIYLLYLFAVVTSIALFFGLGWSAHQGLRFILNDRIRDIFGFAVVLPALLLILYLAVSLDTTRTALCLERSFFSAIRLGLTASFRPMSVFSYLFWFGCSALLTSGSALLFAFHEGGFRQSFFTSFVLLEIVAFSQTILRGRWLVAAQNTVHRINTHSEKRAAGRET